MSARGRHSMWDDGDLMTTLTLEEWRAAQVAEREKAEAPAVVTEPAPEPASVVVDAAVVGAPAEDRSSPPSLSVVEMDPGRWFWTRMVELGDPAATPDEVAALVDVFVPVADDLG